MRTTTLLAVVLGALALAAGAAAAKKSGHLTGTVGPGFTISMSAKTVKAGTYTITINDKADIHDFHLTGPGVDKATGVSAVKTYTWTVNLKRGVYKFVCDPHFTIMHGTLKVT